MAFFLDNKPNASTSGAATSTPSTSNRAVSSVPGQIFESAHPSTNQSAENNAAPSKEPRLELETGVVAEPQDHEIEVTVGSSRVQFEQISESDETEDELPHNRIAQLALAGTLDSRQGCAIHNLKINILIYLYEKINHI